MKGDDEVRRRVRQIGGASPSHSSDPVVDDLKSTIDCLASVTNGFMLGHYGGPLGLEPTTADVIVETSAAVTRLALSVPSVVIGPLDLNLQAWTTARETAYAPDRQPVIAKSSFVPIREAVRPETKPTRGGLFSSTVVEGVGKSSWQLYVEFWGGTLFPKPWHTYILHPAEDSRILEVGSATMWANIVQDAAIAHEGLLYPDWNKLSRSWDAVHMTIPALLAMQGIRLVTPLGILAETYWDVESTFWLRWKFGD